MENDHYSLLQCASGAGVLPEDNMLTLNCRAAAILLIFVGVSQIIFTIVLVYKKARNYENLGPRSPK